MTTETPAHHAARLKYLLDSLKELYPNPNKFTKKLMRGLQKQMDQLQQPA